METSTSGNGKAWGCGCLIIIFLVIVGLGGFGAMVEEATHRGGTVEVNVLSKNEINIASGNDVFSENRYKSGENADYSTSTMTTIAPLYFDWSNNVQWCPPRAWLRMTEPEKQGWIDWIRGAPLGNQAAHHKGAGPCEVDPQ